MNKQLSYLLIGSVAFGANQQVHADWGKDLLTVGGIIVGIGGVVTAANWLFSETDEQLVVRAENTFSQTERKYRSFIMTYNNLRYRGYDENDLYRLATSIWSETQNISRYCGSVSSATRELRKLRDMLHNRLMKLSQQYSNDYNAQANIDRMKRILVTINQFLPHLESVNKYMYTHRRYFDLYEADGNVRNDYRELLELIGRYPHNSYHLLSAIKQFAVIESGTWYPLTTFATELQSDIDRVKSALRRADYRYYNRISCGQGLIDKLSRVLSVLCADPSYAQEYRDLENERIMQEQLRIARERARLERERLKREQERLYLERERVASQRRREYVASERFI